MAFSLQFYTDDRNGMKLLYHPHNEKLAMNNITLKLETNMAGNLTFTMHDKHPYFNELKKIRTRVEVFDGETLIFRGRYLNDATTIYNEKTIICEGELAYFSDTVVRPYSFYGNIRQYLSFLVGQHNDQVESDKRLTLGTVYVDDPNDEIYRSTGLYPSTWVEITDKLIKHFGGMLYISYGDDGSHLLNYIMETELADYLPLSPQFIRLGSNLMDLKMETRGDEIATCIVPVGAPLEGANNAEERRLSIESVNDGSDYLTDNNLVIEYGRIYKTVEFQNITRAKDLLRVGKLELKKLSYEVNSLTITAVDLQRVGLADHHFRFMERVRVISPHNRIDESNLVITEMEIDLLNPSNNVIRIGRSQERFTKTKG